MITFSAADVLSLAGVISPDAEIMLVHDDGLHLMSFAQPVGKRNIVYAHGCNPKIDPNACETARYLVGGDDFGDAVGTAADLITLLHHASLLRATVTESQIICEPQ